MLRDLFRENFIACSKSDPKYHKFIILILSQWNSFHLHPIHNFLANFKV